MKHFKVKIPLLTDGSITLRPYAKRDAPALYEAVIESRHDLWPWLPFAHAGYSLQESKQWIKSRPDQWKKGTIFSFGIFDTRDDSLVGGCGLNDIDYENRRANLGYWVRSSHSRNGIAPAATRLLADWCFQELGFTRIEILVAVDNAKSLRVAEKVGAQYEGVLHNRLILEGRSHDAVMFSLVQKRV